MLKILILLKDTFNYSLFLFSVYRLTKCESNLNLENVKKRAKICGPLALKLLQFISMHTVFKIDSLKFVLEENDIHTFEETKKMYFESFGKDIFNDYNQIELIGSGSIGQVYRANNIILSEYIAIKVKHPGIDESVKRFTRAINFLMKIFFFINFKHIIEEYVNNINSQLNYSLEVENTKKLNKCFKNESCVIIPYIHTFNNSFIIMSYHDGVSFDELDKKTKVKVSLYLNFITLTSILIHDFLHGDLHHGNWKVITGDKLKIIIYDCGLVYSTNNLSYNKLMVNCLLSNNYNKLLYYINNDKILVQKCIHEIDKKINLIINPNAFKRFMIFLNESLKFNLFKNKNCINILNAYSIICETVLLSVNIFTRYIYTEDHSNAVILYNYLGILSKMDIFKELNDFIKLWVNENSDSKDIYNKWLMEQFGHKNSDIINNIIYKRLIT